ncbi:MAG: sulfotransferase family 2 domain-containing protein [Fimbriimonas sp.]|nr:sulfotransferase family 2 domain-containing protein [Fimbriimonas sp.]
MKHIARKPPPPSLPDYRYLFDHIPRTGGSYLASVLCELLGPTSENIDCGPDYPHTHPAEMERLDDFTVIVGHMRLDTVRAFNLIRPRRLISVVRDPVSQILSTYNFWRYNVTADLPHCNLAKTLSFSDFIRVPELRMTLDNPFTRHFFGLWEFDRLEQSDTSRILAVRMSESYSFLGVTERMDETVLAISALFETKPGFRMPKRPDYNASKGKTQVADRDREFLIQLNAMDYEIYRHANERLDRILRSNSVNSQSVSCEEGLSNCISLR